jgi:hypothetical protein
MSLIKKIDVEKHFADRRAMRLGRVPLMSPPRAVLVKPVVPQKEVPAFKKDFVLEHSSLGDSSPSIITASIPIAFDAGRSRLLRPPRSRQA